MAISREIIEEIRSRVSIYDVVSQSVRLQPSGNGRFKGLCPFHQEDTPSFTVTTTQNMFYCFGCTMGGDVFKFTMHLKGLSFVEAAQELADSAGIVIKKLNKKETLRLTRKQKLYKVCALAAEYFSNNLQVGTAGAFARDYLASRDLSKESILNFQLGYAKDSYDDLLNFMHKRSIPADLVVSAGLARYRDIDRPSKGSYSLFRNRLIIPIRDARGRIIAFGGRRLKEDQGPKYINSPETDIYKKSKTLYGLSFARSVIQKENRALLVEGYFDLIAMHQAGFKEAIATCGTALTLENLHILRPLAKRVFTVFDSDEAGQKAAVNSYALMLEAQISSFQISLGKAKDPDDFIKEHGAEKFQLQIESAEPMLVLKIKSLAKKHGLSPSGKNQMIEELLPFLRKMKGVTRDASISEIASRLAVNENLIRELLDKNSSQQEAIRKTPV
ncbi:MAG: DNA primase, partial [Myxococcota bacterium]|nr:DNA primase [Myxococcota bacterium]